MDDVTDLLRLGEEVRRMQLHLASIVESAGDLIISTDRAGAIMTWNSAAAKATGLAELEVQGGKLADHIEEPQNLEVEACFRGIEEIDDRRSVEWPMKCKGGESIPVSWRLSRMTGQQGEATGVVVVGRNLVEQRAMEAQMHQGEKLAALGMVIGGIAHEIRNPLGVSSAAAQLMRQRIARPELLEECIGKVIAGIDRASLVVESLLRFARPKPIAETTRVNVVGVLKNALMFASGEAAAGTSVEWRLEHGADDLFAEGVQNLLELVVINLMLNAFQAMPGGGRLTIGLRRDASGGRHRDRRHGSGDTGRSRLQDLRSVLLDAVGQPALGSRPVGLSFHRAPARRPGGRAHVAEWNDLRGPNSRRAGSRASILPRRIARRPELPPIPTPPAPRSGTCGR